jgi:hypothetical protein
VKEWLEELGSGLVIRTLVSRGRYRSGTVDEAPVSLARLTDELLEGFDVLVVDPAGWEDMASVERATVRGAVGDGLGLLALPGAGVDLASEELWGPFPAVSIAELDEVESRLSSPGLEPLEPLVVEARYLELGEAARPLLVDTAGRSLAAVAPRGLGRVARSVVGETYRWALRGDTTSHRRYWRRLLEAVTRDAERAGAWCPALEPVLCDRPLDLTWVGESPAPAVVREPEGGLVALAPAQDAVEPRLWRATFWPRDAGWHEVSSADGSSWFHAGPATAWPSWRERQASDATSLRAASAARPGAAAGASAVPAPWPHWPLFGLLLVAWGALWGHEQWVGVGRAEP